MYKKGVLQIIYISLYSLNVMADDLNDKFIIKLKALRIEHRELDEQIFQLTESIYIDQLLIRRLKKRKLHLKDSISRIESQKIPDLDA